MVYINDLPDEVLEFIFSHLPPYKDLEECSLVCKRWNQVVHNVVRHTNLNLDKSLTDFRLCWNCIVPVDMAPMIAGRFSHAAVVHENSMYIFGGGSSSSTTFNDLWRFDLSKRQWVRPLSKGTYPSPKACASMVCHKNTLILFGGWRYPSAFPPYQPWRLFDELHVYNISKNQWSMYATSDGPPPMTGHSATIHRNTMVVFGGYQKNDNITGNSNSVWCLDLDTYTWSKPDVSQLKPPPRYGQFQIYLDDDNLLMLGGCGGPNNMFSDAWIMNMSSSVWKWQAVTIKNKRWTATQMWCNPACRVGSKLVVLGPTASMPSDFQFNRQHMPVFNNNHPIRPNLVHQQAAAAAQAHDNLRQRVNPIIEEANRRLHEEQNRPTNRENIHLNVAGDGGGGGGGAAGGNGQDPAVRNNNLDRNNGAAAGAGGEDEAVVRLQRNLQLRQREDDHFLLPKRFDEPVQDRLGMAAFSIDENPGTPRERRLELLRRMEEKYAMRRAMEQISEDLPNPKRIKRNCIALFVCDIKNVLASDPQVDWIEYKNFGIVGGAPERLIHSSIVAGNGELIMFGGLRKEAVSKEPISNTTSTMHVSNAIHFLTFPRNVI